jgi:Protein of unknown function (DUF2867)
MQRAFPTELPLASRLKSSLDRIDYLDCYIAESELAERSLIDIYAAIFGRMPMLFRHLLVLRAVLVKPIGIATVSYEELNLLIDTDRSYMVGEKIWRWTIFEQTEHELIVGANDRHLDFRVSVLLEEPNRVALSTCVMTHNAFGRAYLATILPFHRFGVMKLLSDASAIQD